MFTPIWERFRFFELYFQVGLKRPPRWVTVGDGISTRYSSGWDGICMFFFLALAQANKPSKTWVFGKLSVQFLGRLMEEIRLTTWNV